MGRKYRMKPFKKRVFYDGQEYMIECTQSTIYTPYFNIYRVYFKFIKNKVYGIEQSMLMKYYYTYNLEQFTSKNFTYKDKDYYIMMCKAVFELYVKQKLEFQREERTEREQLEQLKSWDGVIEKVRK